MLLLPFAGDEAFSLGTEVGGLVAHGGGSLAPADQVVNSVLHQVVENLSQFLVLALVDDQDVSLEGDQLRLVVLVLPPDVVLRRVLRLFRRSVGVHVFARLVLGENALVPAVVRARCPIERRVLHLHRRLQTHQLRQEEADVLEGNEDFVVGVSLAVENLAESLHQVELLLLVLHKPQPLQQDFHLRHAQQQFRSQLRVDVIEVLVKAVLQVALVLLVTHVPASPSLSLNPRVPVL